jgi:hypothetical protein
MVVEMDQYAALSAADETRRPLLACSCSLDTDAFTSLRRATAVIDAVLVSMLVMGIMP